MLLRPDKQELKLARDRARDMAEVVVSTGIQPSEYWQLSVLERDELIRAVKRMNKARGS